MTETTNEKCAKCGKPMLVRLGRYGNFLGCSGFPECRTIVSLETKSESGYKPVPCPKCEKGEIVEKRSKRGKIFYACNQYPACDHALWNPPTGEKCPKCKALLVTKGKDNEVVCSNKECK